MKAVQILLLPLFCCLSINLSAQFSVGLKAGYVDAWQNYGDIQLPEDADSHINGFQISGLMQYQFNNWMILGLEPGYVRRGAACVPGYVFWSGNTSLLLNYFELPLILQTKLQQENKPVFVYSKLGVGVARILSGYEVRRISPEGTPVQRKKLDFSQFDFHAWDFGAYGGIGFGLNLGVGQFFAEARYFHSIKHVLRWSVSQNRSLEYNLGYLRQF